MSNTEIQNVQFVTETWLKTNTPIQDNVEYKNLRPSVRLVQDLELQPILGTRLYRKLQTEVKTYRDSEQGDGTFNYTIPEDYKYLLDNFIVHIIAHGFMATATTDILFKYTNIAVNTNSGDNIEPISLKQIQYLQEQHKGRMQFYSKRMIDFLCFNTDKYPEYLEGIEDEMRPSRKAYSGNIYTGRFKKRPHDDLIYPHEYTYDLINKEWRP